jgi:hypothetical protein
VINFINLPTNGTPIPNGYAELDWINFYRMSTNVLLTPMKAAQLSGAVLPSTTYNGGASATFTSANMFNFTSAWLSTDGANPTSTTLVGETTTTTQPSSSGPLLRFPAVYLAQQQHLAPLVDPRNGALSDEYSRYVMASQQIWQVLPVCLNMYDSQPNSDQAENMTKFYTNYSIKAGGAYRWYHPTYVTGLMANLCSPVGFGDPASDADLIKSEVAAMPAPTSNVANNGQLNQLSRMPLSGDQCTKLRAFSSYHDQEAAAAITCAQNGIPPASCAASIALKPSIQASLAAWVATAGTEAQRQLFDLIWDGDVNPNLPLDEFINQKSSMMQDHMRWETSFNCATGTPPDVKGIQLAASSHGLRHLCMALDPKFSTTFPVYFRHYNSVYYYDRVTCAGLANK